MGPRKPKQTRHVHRAHGSRAVLADRAGDQLPIRVHQAAMHGLVAKRLQPGDCDPEPVNSG